MGFLKNFFKNVFHENATALVHNSFEHVSEDDLEAHLSVARYGSFRLTEAVRPSYDLKIIPSQGYRHDSYQDDESKQHVPVLMAAASAEKLFEVFIDLLEPLGQSVDVVLETSHNRDKNGHVDLYREQIDMPVLKSMLYDFEEMLTNDGCTGIAVLNPSAPLEVQFDEHKLLIVYGSNLTPFEHILESHGIYCSDALRFITEAEHVHSSSEEYVHEFEQLQTRLGMDGSFA
jgi:hypothetical protein